MYDITTLLTFFNNTSIEHFRNVLYENAHQTASTLENAYEAMEICAPAASTYGTFEECVAAIGLLSNYGIRYKLAGHTLRCIYATPIPNKSPQLLSDRIAILKTIMSELGNHQGIQYLSRIYGKQALIGVLTLINAPEGKLEQLISVYMNV